MGQHAGPRGFLRYNIVVRGPDGVLVPVVYSDRVAVFGEGGGAPRRTEIVRSRAEFAAGVAIDPGQPWASRGIPLVLRRLPRISLDAEDADYRLTGVLPGSQVFGIPSLAALLVRLPAGSDRDAAALALSDRLGSELIPLLILVVAGAEPRPVRRALERRS